MKFYHNRTSKSLVSLLAMVALALFLIAPARAQEATEPSVSSDTATVTPTDAPTDVPAAIPSDTPTEAPTNIPTPAPTEEPSATPEVTTAPENTATTAPTDEVTATSQPTEQPTMVATPESQMFADDFQAGANPGWALDGWTVATEGDNAFLTASENGTLASIGGVALADFTLSLNIRVDALAQANIALNSGAGAYTLVVDSAGNVDLYRDGARLTPERASTPEPDTAAVWRRLDIAVRAGAIGVTVDNEAKVSYTDPNPLPALSFAFSKNGDGVISIDDVVINRLEAPATLPSPTDQAPTEQPTEVVTAEPTSEATLEATAEVTPEATLEATAEATGEATPELTAQPDLNEMAKAKLDPAIYELLQTRLQAGDVQAESAPPQSNIIFDEAGRLRVVMWAADGHAGTELAAAVQAVGGAADATGAYYVVAYVPLEGITALANLPAVGSIELPSAAVSTGPVGAPLSAPTGTTISQGFDIVGANDWHAAGYTGGAGTSQIKIAVIDTGFNTAGAQAAEYACLGSVIGGPGTSTHGIAVAEVLCDIAPTAAVTGYVATDAASVATAISNAQIAKNKIILIALDLGADASPGDGTSGGITSLSNAVYTNITSAKNAGIVVIAGAGNSNGRYASFTYNGTATVNIKAKVNDQIAISWNRWGQSGDFGSVNFTGASTSRNPAAARTASKPAAYRYTINSCALDPCDITMTLSGGTNMTNAYVQVQVLDASGANIAQITGSTPASDSTAGSLARPADSPDVLTVGAVCGSVTTFADMMDASGSFAISSHGPVFAAGGASPGTIPNFDVLRDKVKPDIVAPSGVSTSGTGSGDCKNGGLGGTSGAAAHAAGMVALLLSNTNSNLKSYLGANATLVNHVRDYLQAHATDMPFGSGADGFDMKYGAGLAVLGNPDPTDFLNGTTSITTAADTTTLCPSGRIYVKPLNLTNPIQQNGSLASPYSSLAYAMTKATSGQCVTLLPGEYTTPVLIAAGLPANLKLQSYQAGRLGATGLKASTVWVNNGYSGGGGFSINTVNNITIDGIKFVDAGPYGQGGLGRASGIEVKSSTGTVISGNTFTNFLPSGPNGASDALSPVVVSASSQNVTIQGNTFTNNGSTTGGGVNISNSGSTTPILVLRNTFDANPGNPSIYDAPLVQISNSQVNIVSNRFTNNGSPSIIRVQNTNDSTTAPTFSGSQPVNVFSNLFYRNRGDGPMVHLVPSRLFRFINNTVVENSPGVASSVYAALIGRGTTTNATIAGGYHDGLWDINNNIFAGNTAPAGLVSDLSYESVCQASTGGQNNGTKNNWIYNPSNSVTLGGDCDSAFSNASFNNRLDTNPTNNFTLGFVGAAFDANDPYQLKGDADAVDAGDNTLVIPASLLTNAVDVLGNLRVSGTGGTPTIDVGAYEYQTVNVRDYAVPARTEDDPTIFVNGVNKGITIDLLHVAPPDGPIVSGGFPGYKLQIQTYPTNFDPNPSNACGGQPLLFNATTQIITYCPPPDYYNSGETPDVIPPVTFTYKAIDKSNVVSQSTGTATITITKTPDTPLDSTANLRYSIVAPAVETTTPYTFRLRPYVRFNNFRLSTTQKGKDYPYDYKNAASFTDTCTSPNPGIISGGAAALASAINNADGYSGLVTVNLAANQTGCLEFQYDVTDATGSTPPLGTSTNKFRLDVVTNLPSNGLYDDTSFSFNYRGAGLSDRGSWTAAYSEPNINNTLHQTSVLNDTAEFLMTGSSFALYMQASALGGYWELQIVNAPEIPSNAYSDPGMLAFKWNGQSPTSADNETGVRCKTTAPTGKKIGTLDNSRYISNTGTALYVVSCEGLTEGEAHYVRIINRQTGRQVSIDAISINLTDPTPLKPGFHEVTESQITPLFPGWTLVTNPLASNQRALSTTNGSASAVTFDFQGTGLEIGTALQRAPIVPVGATYFGAQYDICVMPQGSVDANEKICQTYDNGFGTTTTTVPTWGVFRPFYGLDPSQVYTATIAIKQIRPGATMYIDSIVVLDSAPTAPAPTSPILPFGVTDDSQRTLFVFGNGLDSSDTWNYDTGNILATNRTLTSLKTGIRAAGPFVSFDIPATADIVNWYRTASAADSQAVLVCVDRGQLNKPDQNNNFCKQYDLRTQGNPLVIKESDFPNGWGGPMPGTPRHTVEIFSLSNQPFNFDYVQVLNSAAPLASGYYEQNASSIKFFDNFQNIPGTAPFTTVKNALASGGSVASTTQVRSGAAFQFHGTGFTTYFTFDPKADAVKICYKQVGTSLNTALIQDVLNTGKCQTYDNQSSIIRYKAGRSVLGLPSLDYTVAVQMLADQNEPTAHIATAKPITMQIDAVRIYDTALPGNTLSVLGQRYEPSFANAAADNRFGYFGTTWKSVTGTAARLYSGQNYDSVTNEIGAGVVFKATGANRLIIYRDTRTGLASMQVCVIDNAGTRTCTIISNTGGTANQADVVVPLTGTAPYTVSIVTTDYGIFNLDAIALANSAVLTAPAGGSALYEANDPGITYSTSPLQVSGDTNDRPQYAQWVDVVNTQFTGKRAMQSLLAWPTNPPPNETRASVSFQFTGTGFSLITLFDATSARALTAQIAGGSINYTATLNSNSSVARYGAAHSITGLPFGTYTVTITENDSPAPLKRKLVVDALEIYGDYGGAAMSQGTYDNTTLDSSGNSYLRFGPSNGVWTQLSSTATVNYLGRTALTANRYGASLDFKVTGATSITVLTPGSTSTAVQLCTTTASSTQPTCLAPVSLVGKAKNTWTLGGAPGDYNVSLVNLGQGQSLVVDAVLVNDTVPSFDAAQPLPPGYYEETEGALHYATAPTDWSSLTGATYSGGTATATTSTAAEMSFTFSGTGFAIYSLFDAKAEQVKICWKSGTNSLATTMSTGTCQTYDNQSAAAKYKAARVFTALGLTPGTYTAAIQLLDANSDNQPDDNGTPTPHNTPTSTPITLVIDAVEVYGDNVGSLTPLTPAGGRYETSFANRVADDRFLYYGAGWRSVTGTAANAYSGQNYDSIANVIGAGVTFRVNSADTLTLFRQTSTGFAPLQVCSASTGALTTRFCSVVTNTSPVGYQQGVSIPLGSNGPTGVVGSYVVTINTLDTGTFNLDAIQVSDSTGPLSPGFYEENAPGLTYNGSSWALVNLATYTAGHAQESKTAGDTLTFSFTGAAGFEVGTTIDRNGGEMEVCVNTSNTFPANRCYTYENENTLVSTKVSRSITGLDSTQTYFVQVRNAEDGQTVLPPGSVQSPKPRAAAYPVKLHIDFVNIFAVTPANSPAVISAPGLYNEDAVDGSSVPYLQLQPANRWAKITGTGAAAYSNKSYVTVADSFGRASTLYAGPAATLNVAVPAQGATVILFTGVGTTTNPLEVLACAVMKGATLQDPATNCTKITDLRTKNQLVLNSSKIAALGGGAGNVTLSIRALTPGSLKIDGFQVIFGSTLQPGVYDDVLMDNGAVLNTGTSTWTPVKVPAAYGGYVMAAQPIISGSTDNNPKFTFDFQGTGFGVITMVDSLGTDMRLCYKRQANASPFPTNSTLLNQNTDVTASGTAGVICKTVTTDALPTPATVWNAKNGSAMPKPAIAYQYMFSIYGLPDDTYTVEVRIADDPATTTLATDRLKIDGVAVFGDVTSGGAGSRLLPGTLYDNNNAAGISYEPGVFWTSATALYGPPRGPYLNTESSTMKVGSIMQVYLNGNALVLYQQAASTNSRSVRVCYIDSQGKLQCSTFSQNYARLTYFSPIVFYGFGSNADHVVILENLDYNKKFNVDGLQVLP